MLLAGLQGDGKERGSVSDERQNPDWWLAADGKWYPPESHPSAAPLPRPNPGTLDAPIPPEPSPFQQAGHEGWLVRFADVEMGTAENNLNGRSVYVARVGGQSYSQPLTQAGWFAMWQQLRTEVSPEILARLSARVLSLKPRAVPPVSTNPVSRLTLPPLPPPAPARLTAVRLVSTVFWTAAVLALLGGAITTISVATHDHSAGYPGSIVLHDALVALAVTVFSSASFAFFACVLDLLKKILAAVIRE